nr:Uncharacterised protein [Raoultella sp. NCTC 9187]
MCAILRVFLPLRPYPARRPGKGLALTVHAEAGEALANRHHFQSINIDVFRQVGDPPHGFRHVVRRQRLGIFVGFAGFRVVAFKADVGKLGAATSPGSMSVTRIAVPCRSVRR